MTTFAYSITQSKGPIPELLRRMGHVENNRFTVLLEILAGIFPIIWSIPNPMTEQWKRLRRELGVVADDVWVQGVKAKGMHAKLLELIGDFPVITLDSALTFAQRSVIETKLSPK